MNYSLNTDTVVINIDLLKQYVQKKATDPLLKFQSIKTINSKQWHSLSLNSHFLYYLGKLPFNTVTLQQATTLISGCSACAHSQSQGLSAQGYFLTELYSNII